MHTFSLFAFALVAPAVVRAMPASTMEDDGHLETILHKRDDALSPRDLELAEMHGVDLTKMFKHSVQKRADGDDITIWVHNSWQEGFNETEEADAGLERRQHVWGEPFRYELHPDQCGHSSFHDRTNDHSPYTGGLQAITRWGQVWGGFEIQADCCLSGGPDVVIAGSNSGGNAAFNIVQSWSHGGRRGRVGARDIADVTRDSLTRFQRHRNGAWRMSALGTMPCATGHRNGHQSLNIDWHILSYGGRVPGTK